MRARAHWEMLKDDFRTDPFVHLMVIFACVTILCPAPLVIAGFAFMAWQDCKLAMRDAKIQRMAR